MKRLFTLIIIGISLFSFAQPVSSIRGVVIDAEAKTPLPFIQVNLVVKDSVFTTTITDSLGQFSFSAVKVGKYSLLTQSDYFESTLLPIELIVAKETVVELKLQESITTIQEVKIQARRKGEVLNEMALASAQQFSVEETNRYAGSRGDPARMASNFAGVQGADDSRNDIVVRGNSPLGILWKVEGIDIPNPSHFAITGSSGGPVSIINNKFLSNSDFFMSAFPAQYGNSIAGVFDLKMRSGNSNQYESSFQFGFLGTELLSEGPLSKNKKSSYLVMGRYSTLSLFKLMGISIGTDAVPVYGDGAFKLNWKLKKGGTLSLFGIGGKSTITILISDQKKYSPELYGEGDRDQYFGTGMFVSGLTYKKSIAKKLFYQSTLAYSFEEQHAHHNYVQRHLLADGETIQVDKVYPLMGYQFKTAKTSLFNQFNYKLSPQHQIRYGLNVDIFHFHLLDSVLDVTQTYFFNRWNFNGNAFLIQPFVQWKWRQSIKSEITLGLHSQYFSTSHSYSLIEPRAAWKYKFKPNQSIFMGVGLHSQTQPYYTYFYHLEGHANMHNERMNFTKSWHSSLGFEQKIKESLLIRSEVYYQYLFQVPVTIAPSSFSLINMGSGFARFFPDPLKNTGKAKNYGIELTLQKYFDQSFYFMWTSSLYQSLYQGSDLLWRNTSYNGNYVTNLLIGKEFYISKKHTLQLGTKITTAGGKRYGYVDVAKSQLYADLIYKDSAFNTRQFKPYFRMDLKINWRMNTSKVTHEIGLDLVNVFNTENLLGLAYAPSLVNPSKEPIVVKQQLGFLPLFYYKLDFKTTQKLPTK